MCRSLGNVFIFSFFLLASLPFCCCPPPADKDKVAPVAPPKSPNLGAPAATVPPTKNFQSETTASIVNEKPLPSKSAIRILVAYAPGTDSHLGSMLPLLNRLSSAGHQVHILRITAEKKEKKFAQNIHEIRIKMDDLSNEEVMKELGTLIWTKTLHSPLFPLIYQKIAEGHDSVLQNHSNKFCEVLNASWDLLIIDEMFTLHGYAFAELLRRHGNVPYVVFSTSTMTGPSAWANANGKSLLIHPHLFVPTPRHANDGFKPSSFAYRLINVLECLGDFAANIFIESMQILPRLVSLTGKRHFTFGQVYEHSQMAMVASISRLALPEAEQSEVLNIGLHCDLSAPALPEEYRQFVEDPASKGTIYTAFGSIIPWDYAPEGVLDAFLEAFRRLPQYRFIFAFNGKSEGRTVPGHVRLVKWAPQMAILFHAKTRLFLTHGGLKSVKESLCSKTPMLALPVFAEQNHNARLVVEMGIGIAMNKYDIRAEALVESLEEVLENPKYAKRVKRLQQISMDSGPMDQLDVGEFYVRKIVERRQKRHAWHSQLMFHKRKGVQLSSFEHFHVDLAILLLLFTFVLSK